MDIIKGLRSIGRMRRKELGFPAPAWVFGNNGLWIYANDEYSTYVNSAYKKIPWIYAIISHIIDKASDAPIIVMKEKKGRSAAKFDKALRAGLGLHDIRMKALKERTFDEIDHPVIGVFENPNPIDTEKTLKEQFLGYLYITGNAFMYAGTPGKASVNATKPAELWCLPSPAVRIISGDSRDPIKGYQIEGTTTTIEAWEVAHCKYFNPTTYYDQSKMLYGMSPLIAARGVINQADASDFAQGMLYKNMGPRGILSGEKDGLESDEQAMMIKDRFKQLYQSPESYGDIVVTSATLRWQQMGLSPVDLNLIEADENYLTKLAAIYRYPKEIITGSENVASQGVSDKQVITKCVLPALRRFDDCMTKWVRQLYNDDSLRIVSDTSYYPELSDDKEKQAKWLAQAWWITPNEKRAMMDYDDLPDENMDKVLVPGGAKTLEDIADPIEIDDETAFQDFDQSQGDSGDTDNS